MQFYTQTSMTHQRVVSLQMRAHSFGEEQFLSVLARAFASNRYRIEINYISGESTEVQSLVIGSSDEEGYPHIDPEGAA